jgi:hypothetical protein
MSAVTDGVSDLIGPVLSRLMAIAPRPVSLEATGLSPETMADLLLKHLLRAGAMTSAALSERLGVAGPVIEPVVQFLRQESRVELQARAGYDHEVRLALTLRGRQSAEDALRKCGYIGPAPVPLDTYSRVVRAQTIARRSLARQAVYHSYRDIIMADDLRDRVGVAMGSGRAIFIYGPAGSGKTYIASRLIAALPGEVLVPHAVAVNDKIIRVYDASLHERLELIESNRRLLLAQGFDSRFALCERPMVMAGGELTVEMLDVQFNSATSEYSAPIQMKANGGVLVIDDLGRQRFIPQRLFDRWIAPLEQQVDHLSAGADALFATPCDAIIVFSTNLEPRELADDGVLRRLGYKIQLGPLSAELYSRIWASVCSEFKVHFDPKLLHYTLTKLYADDDRPLLACHPRDLVSMALDKAAYDDRAGQFNLEDLRWAWSNYFLPNSEDDDAERLR